MFQEKARAKINLTLEILGKRKDGYHELKSLVAFADFGDELCFTPENNFSLKVDGPFAPDLTGENLIEKAVNFFSENTGVSKTGYFHLKKNLPVASGIGGGSADAAAAIRLLLQHSQQSLSSLGANDIARELGADIPVCLNQKPVIMSGIGEKLQPVDSFPILSSVLINPRVAVSTGTIFRELSAGPLQPGKTQVDTIEDSLTGSDDIWHYILNGKNHLQSVAVKLEPAITRVLSALENQAGCQLARMSGSGATCFGIFETMEQAMIASSIIHNEQPGWWVQHCRIL